MYISNQSNLVNAYSIGASKSVTKQVSSIAFDDYIEIIKSNASTKETNEDNLASNSITSLDTNKGKVDIDLDDYLKPRHSPKGPINLGDVLFLLPTAHNVDTLTKYSEKKLKDLLEQYAIPKPPSSIEFDQEGQLVLPTDYAHAEQLKYVFSERPEVQEALRTTAAIASHYAGIMEGQPFRDEMATARTQEDRERIAAKYSYLFDDNRPPIRIVLSFLEDGSLLVGKKSNTNFISSEEKTTPVTMREKASTTADINTLKYGDLNAYENLSLIEKANQALLDKRTGLDREKIEEINEKIELIINDKTIPPEEKEALLKALDEEKSAEYQKAAERTEEQAKKEITSLIY